MREGLQAVWGLILNPQWLLVRFSLWALGSLNSLFSRAIQLTMAHPHLLFTIWLCCPSLCLHHHRCDDIFCGNTDTLAFTNGLLTYKKCVITLKKMRVYMCCIKAYIYTTKSAQATWLCLILFSFYHLLLTLHKNEECYQTIVNFADRLPWFLGAISKRLTLKLYNLVPSFCSVHTSVHGITKHTPHASIKWSQ